MNFVNKNRRYVWKLLSVFDINNLPTGKFKMTVIDNHDGSIYTLPKPLFPDGIVKVDDVIKRFDTLCIELNTKYEDDLIYLNEVKKYAINQ